MANAQNGNSFYVDSVSAATAPNSFIAKKQVGVASIVWNPNVAGDALTLCDLNPSDGKSAGIQKLIVMGGTAKNSVFLNFYDYPIMFPNGLWVSAVAASGSATITYYTNSG